MDLFRTCSNILFFRIDCGLDRGSDNNERMYFFVFGLYLSLTVDIIDLALPIRMHKLEDQAII
jgi:hypothetical protein